MLLVPTTRSFDRSIDRLFERFFEDLPLARAANGNGAPRSPALDVAETDSAYTVTLDLPGVAKDEVAITIDGRNVSISTRREREAEKKSEPDNGVRLLWRERSSSAWARSFALPEEIDQDASAAKLDNGVLTLTLAKKRAAAAKVLTIN